MDDDEDTPAATVNENDRVNGWRTHVLIEAGYPVAIAEQLAAGDVDLHKAVELVQQGCPPQTAAQILL